jgi:hypothetical protein
MTLYLLATADVQPDPVLCLFLVVFYFYLAWLLLTSGGAE